MLHFYSFVLAFSLLASGSLAIASETKNAKPQHQYSAEFMADYRQECIQTSMTEGLDKADAKKLCNCTINRFQQQYSQEEFIELTNASTTDEQAEMALIEVGQVCFEQILYEQ